MGISKRIAQNIEFSDEVDVRTEHLQHHLGQSLGKMLIKFLGSCQ